MSNSTNLNNNLINKRTPDIVNRPNDEFDTVLFLQKNEGRKGEGGLRTKGYFNHSYKKFDGEWWVVDRDDNLLDNVILEVPVLDELPLVSIITVVFNGDKFLEETILSVINQSYPNIEYIIIDGGSTDKSLEIIHKYDAHISYWVSEKDKGMYEALNKGLSLITGKIYASLNSDDQYFKSTISIMVSKSDGSNIIFGNPCFLYSSGNISCRKLFNITYFDLLAFGECTLLPQPTTFIKYSTAKAVGLFDLSYKVASDYDYLLRVLKKSKAIKHINKSFTLFRRHDGALTERASTAMKDEAEEIFNNYKNNDVKKFNALLLKINYIIKNPVISYNFIKKYFSNP